MGPVYAKKLVRAFGEKGFDVIETEPDRLREVDGVGPVRAASILAVFRVRGLLFNWQLRTTKTETAWKPLSKRKSGTAVADDRPRTESAYPLN